MKKYISMALLVFVLVTLLFSFRSYAESVVEVDYKTMHKVMASRQNYIENLRVRLYVNAWANRNKDKSETRIFYSALYDICDLATPTLGKRNIINMLDGEGNCVAYSTLFQAMLETSGIECKVVYNKTHMWCKAKVDGVWKEIDVIFFDNFLEGRWTN